MFFCVVCFSLCLKLLRPPPLLLLLLLLHTTTTTPPPACDSCLLWCICHLTVMMDPSSVGLPTLDQHDVVLPPQLILRDVMRGPICLITISQQQQPLVPDAFSDKCQIYHRPLQVIFSFRVEPLTNSYVLCWFLLWCLLSAFRFQFGCKFTNGKN